MISVSSSDARKDLGLGFGGRAGKMEENEVGDGEAASCCDDHSSDTRVDPDISLSYIDEKLENVLGHFQKDFEGGVSAENLGAKFGGYGSFLPMYHLSPVRTHPKSPQEVQNHIIPRSQINSSLEGGACNCSASTTVHQVYTSGSPPKDSSSNVLVKLKESVESSNRRTSDGRQEFTAKSFCSSSSNQKNLRVRIRVGVNDLTSRKNVLADSGQSLGASPSTLLEKSLSENDEGFLGGLDDSPSTILMAMISFPLHTDIMLSPLSDDLVNLGEEKEIMKDDGRYFRVAKLDSENTHVLMDVPDSQKCDTKSSIAKKEKLTETAKYLPLSNRPNGRYTGSETEKETDMQSCEELVSKTLRLPLLSCLSPKNTHPKKRISEVSDACVEAVEGTTRGMIISGLEAALMGSNPWLEENVVSFSAPSVKQVETAIFINRTGKDQNLKEGEILTMISESKRKKAPNAEHTAYSMDKVSQRETGPNLHKISQKSSNSIVPAIERLRDEHSAVNKSEKNAHANKLQEGIGGSEHTYREFFGNMGKSKEEIQSSPNDKVMKGKLPKHNVCNKGLSSESQLLTPSVNAPPSKMIEDNWVLCEKCQKWRLLPNGMNPDNFPEDWDCSMLSWLPGMNCCTVHQDLTTEAVHRLNRAPSLEVKGTMNRNPDSTKLAPYGEALEKFGKGKEWKSLKDIARGTDTETRNNLPLVSEPDSKNLTKSSDSSVDRCKTNQNDTWKVSNQLFGEGEMKISSMEIERDLDRKLCGTSKKRKAGESQFFDVDKPRSDKILKGAADDKIDGTQASATRVKENANASLHCGCDNRDVLGKRKLKDNQECGIHATDLRGSAIERQKRLRVSSSVGMESQVDSVNADLDRRVSQASDKDCSPHLPSMATALSSLKTSCSRKTKGNIHETKGSLIESSPLRMSDSDKSNSGKRNLSGKDGSYDTNFRTSTGIQGCSDGEGSSRTDRSKRTNKNKKFVLDNNVHGLSSVKVMGQVPSASELDHRDQNHTLDDFDRNTQYSEKLKAEQSSDGHRPHDENGTRGKSQLKGSRELSFASSSEKKRDMIIIKDVQDPSVTGEVRSNEGRSKKIPAGKVPNESSKEETKEYHDPNAKLDANGSQDYASTQKLETPKTIPRKRVKGEMTSGKVRKKPVQPSGSGQVEVLGQGSDGLNTKIIGHDDNIERDKCLRNPNRIGNKLKGHDGISSLKKGSTSQAVSNSIKEATDLKHMADRLKNAGSNPESTSFYFQAALKFLYGASLLESSPEHSKHKNIARSRQIYDSTAKLCEFCAREYEKYKDMGAAALAYKCMEVAYLRIIYSSHGDISRYRYELQAALKVIPPGESPSVTDVKNSSHTSAAEMASSNVVRSPKVTGNQFISSTNHSHLSQLLAFSQNAISAMDASRKAQMAFGTAKGKSVDVHYDSDGISHIKRALDFNFQDMEGLLLLVRLAMEAINR